MSRIQLEPDSTSTRFAQTAAYPFTSFSSDISLSEGAGHVHSRLESAPSSFSITEEWMPEGVDGTYQCLDAMCDAVMGRIPPDMSGYQDEWIIALAEKVTAEARSERAEVEKIWQYACAITYRPHPIDIQIVSDARRTVERGWADCVSLSVLICTLAMARGFDCRFVAQFWSDDELFTHVLPEIYVDGRWLVCDAVAKDLPIDTLQKLPDGGFNLTWEIA